MSLAFLAAAAAAPGAFAESYFAAARAADEARAREIAAATTIQRVWRGFRTRKRLDQLRAHARRAQTAFRAHLARRRVQQLREAHELRRREKVFHAMATVIQRWFRGYLARRDRVNCRRRREYLQRVEERAQRLMAQVAEESKKLNAESQRFEEAERAARFDATTANLHHLLSTRAQPGIFNSRLGEEFQVTAFGVPVEEHIRVSAKVRGREREEGEGEGERERPHRRVAHGAPRTSSRPPRRCAPARPRHSPA